MVNKRVENRHVALLPRNTKLGNKEKKQFCKFDDKMRRREAKNKWKNDLETQKVDGR